MYIFMYNFHLGVGSPSSQWDFWGSTLVTSQYVRLTPDERSKQGSIWNTVVSCIGVQGYVMTFFIVTTKLHHQPFSAMSFITRLTVFSVQPCYLKDWEMHVQFKVHGSGKKNLHGDGIAIWYTKDRLHPGKTANGPAVRFS